MEKMSVLHETVLEWQTASSNIRNNVKQQTQARVEVISSLKREKTKEEERKSKKREVETKLQFFREQLEKAEASLQKSRDQHAENQRKHREEEAKHMDCTYQLQRLANQEVTFDSMKEVLRDCLTRLGRFKDCLRQYQMFFDKLRGIGRAHV